MQYTHPRFRSMEPVYKKQPGTKEGAVNPPTTEDVVHPAFGSQWETTPEAVENFPGRFAGPMTHPRFQEGWTRQTVNPAYESTPATSPFGPAYENLQAVPGNLGPQGNLPAYYANPQVGGRTISPFTGGTTWGQASQWTPEQQWSQGSQFTQSEVGSNTVRQPACDVFDEGENLVLEIELPGIAKDDIDLVCDESGLSLKAQSTSTRETSNLVQGERGDVAFERYIPLNVEVLPADIEASFDDGILTITAPKKEPTSGLQTVNIE